MTIKSILFVIAVAALAGAAIASCPNACSGHGSCGNHDRCSCYANFVGGDCSEKGCPHGRSGQECSGRGTCDRGSGTCECADGYSGASCQRIACPNDCSGKGSCDTTTGMCNCAGGYAGNDCGTRLCPKGDDPLTHEVENSGDGTASQTAEVQTVTFNGGRGLGGTATLTYNDLYGQSWTTRPFNVGGDNVFRLEVSIVAGTDCSSNKCDVTLTYNGNVATIPASTTNGYALANKLITAGTIRKNLLPLFAGHMAKPYVPKDRGNALYVREHYSTTSVKIGGSVRASTRVTFDIALPIDMSSHDDNGGYISSFTAGWATAPAANTAELNLYSLGDRSAEIESALTSLPNQVIPSVSVVKVGVTDTATNSDGSNGHAYAQSYEVTFSNEANSGDQNMLTCNAAPCDEDGCINRGPGVSEVRYMHHDPENRGEGINFVNQGYFIMDIGAATHLALSAGSIKIMWDTGAGIDSAIFAVVATAAEVQTALRTITGWEGVTVELWGSILDSDLAANIADNSAKKLLSSHQFKVTFAAGYDDLGKTPTFYTMTASDGAYATATNSPTARIYDQRFSNSLWLGKVTGFVILDTATDGLSGVTKHVDIDGNEITIATMPENGDVWVTSNTYYGTGGIDANDAHAPGTLEQASGVTIHNNAAQASTIAHASTKVGQDTANKNNFAYLKEGKTSVQTSDYFAVGSTIEVLPTTWDASDANLADVDIGVLSNNKYRKFKVTGHVTNQFNREFAKLDSFPADDGIAHATAANDGKPDYNLKITNNNATVHTYPSLAAKVTLNEVQLVVLDNGEPNHNDDQVYKLYYKGEESQNMDYLSTPEQVAEEINGFSALSGPVTVTGENGHATNSGYAIYAVEFDAKDGDVAEMTAVATVGSVSVDTRANGWSIEGPVSLGLDTMQAGGIVNITEPEECKFTVAGTDNGVYVFCYDGVCGGVTAAAGADPTNAIQSIKDDNGDALLSVSGGDHTSKVYKATLPPGKSCDGLEMLDIKSDSTVTGITKEVTANNNGRLFRIKRSFLQSKITYASAATPKVTCSNNTCTHAVANVDGIIISQGSGGTACGVAVPGTDGAVMPILRTITTVEPEGVDVAAKMTVAAFTDAHSDHTTKCVYRIARHVITLDAMPAASATTVSKSIEYTSPVGSCSVTETTKGTHESYECSNRGNCDGKSGLCSCYEGYSGQSCQQQTVLV